jgi:tetratricopeptide (TPR) repeat protein
VAENSAAASGRDGRRASSEGAGRGGARAEGAGAEAAGVEGVEGADRPDVPPGSAGADREREKGAVAAVALGPAEAAELSEFLEKPATTAMRRRQYTRAIALYRGLVAARGEGHPIALDLARAWTLAGRYDEAGEVLDAFLAASRDSKLRAGAQAERDRIAKARFFFDKSFDIPPATGEAERCFDLGRKAYRKRKFSEALLYYKMGHALDANFPGFLRELGATYEKLGALDERLAFYTSYLRLRPIGKNADFVRKQLEESKTELGVLNVDSSLPCDEFWLSGTRGARLPVRSLKVPPGKFKALCVNFAHELAYFEYATVKPDKETTLQFRWAIIENQLANPLGRIRIEDPRSAGDMIDLGVSSTAVGVVVPAEDRPVQVELVAEDGTRNERRFLRLTPGQRYKLAW